MLLLLLRTLFCGEVSIVCGAIPPAVTVHSMQRFSYQREVAVKAPTIKIDDEDFVW